MRYNSPPNWPQPPAGWSPPDGWKPDPAWGPAPDGWRFWLDEPTVSSEPSVSATTARPVRPVADQGPHKTRSWLLPSGVGIAALLLGVAIGAAGKSNGAPKDTAATVPSPAPTVTVTATAPVSTQARATATATVTATVTQSVTQPAAPTTAQTAPNAAAKVLDVAGSGIKNTKDFTVSSDEWTLAYAYDCTGFGGSGNFAVISQTPNGGFGDVLVNELGAKGQSATVGHGSGTYYLSINSECNWHVVVTNGA